MTRIPLYQVDAFTSRVFGGNPAAVCPLEDWPADATMQAIAAENNLSETAFFIDRGDRFDLRWFTPAAEVDLCGHATLATAWVLFNELGIDAKEVGFDTLSGRLTVRNDGDRLVMDFPARPPGRIEPSPTLAEALGHVPHEVLRHDNCLAVFESEAEVRDLSPDIARIKALDFPGVIVTAPGEEVDFVSRYFAPKYGIPEDPVTGSAHCELMPYWANRLGSATLTARQISTRGGELHLELVGERVLIGGRCAKFLEGIIEI
jgi:PhzF family phenazine biosynthesis protein